MPGAPAPMQPSCGQWAGPRLLITRRGRGLAGGSLCARSDLTQGWDPVLLKHPGLTGLRTLRRWAGHRGARGQGLSWEPYKGPCSPSPDSTPTLPVPPRCPPHAHLDKPASVSPWLKRPLQAGDPPSPATLTPGLPLSVEGRMGFPAGHRY